MREPNKPGGAVKTVSCSCCAGMIIEMIKSGASGSVKAHHVQLIAQRLSALTLVRRAGSGKLFTFLDTGNTCLVTFYMYKKSLYRLNSSTPCYVIY